MMAWSQGPCGRRPAPDAQRYMVVVGPVAQQILSRRKLGRQLGLGRVLPRLDVAAVWGKYFE